MSLNPASDQGSKLTVESKPTLREFIEKLLQEARREIEICFEIQIRQEDFAQYETGIRARYLSPIHDPLCDILRTRKDAEIVVRGVFAFLRSTGITLSTVNLEPKSFTKDGVLQYVGMHLLRMLVYCCLHNKDIMGSDLDEDLKKIEAMVVILEDSDEETRKTAMRDLKKELGNSIINPNSLKDLLTKEGETLGQYR